MAVNCAVSADGWTMGALFQKPIFCVVPVPILVPVLVFITMLAALTIVNVFIVLLEKVVVLVLVATPPPATGNSNSASVVIPVLPTTPNPTDRVLLVNESWKYSQYSPVLPS